MRGVRRAFALRVALCAALCALGARGAVHPYAGGRFSPLGDAFVFRAGREGLFRSRSEARWPCRVPRVPLLDASRAPLPPPQAAEGGGSGSKGVANGKSYIRLSKARGRAAHDALCSRGVVRSCSDAALPRARRTPRRRLSLRGQPTPRRGTPARPLRR